MNPPNPDSGNTNTIGNDDTQPNHPRPKTILVASLNPVKIAAALHGFEEMFPNTAFTARGIAVPSGVPDQPFTDQETLLGARNRAVNARAAESGAAAAVDFWVGIEGGVCEDPSSGPADQKQTALLQSFAWVVILGNRHALGSDSEQNENEADSIVEGKARTLMYYLPLETSRLVRGGMELGHAEDQIWGQTNSKQKNGSIGLLTGDVIDRKGYIQQAVVGALIPFRNPGLRF
ncbi:inosine triphosphate pyrophosphatase-like protein [Rhypophila decipiens]|uniref:inosine/xanthosine triphosphatase n=1 Tax=Rhypophila decipiens TaxID=261697 RepID=A0AAN6YA00_9PEZI|nr:inosine triphosphate pyrophosphatase-like protein [Rhypophila decipiens]